MVYSESKKRKIWNKGRVIAGYNSDVWRYDAIGSPIKYSEYSMETKHGWDIDHIDPRGSKSDIDNLQPLQWQNNRQKANN